MCVMWSSLGGFVSRRRSELHWPLQSRSPRSPVARLARLLHASLALTSAHVRLPHTQVGKSTLFNTISGCAIPAENFPFCTIDPNSARVNVPDDRFNWLVDVYKPKSAVPAFLEVTDIAGLIKGAADGEGLGNAFLSHIQAVDGIFHVVRAFEDADVVHVEDRVDPVEDLEIIHNELRLKDLERCRAEKERLAKARQPANKGEHKDHMEACEVVLEWLEAGKDIRHNDNWTIKQIEWLNVVQFISAKPVVYLVNLSEKDYQRKKNKWLPKVHAWIQEHAPGSPMIPFSGALEQSLADMPEDERKVYCKENEVASALPKIIQTGFKAVNLIQFMTAGPDEVKCWQIREGSKAPQAAGAIHTDFERGFICAEVMHFDELKELGSESAVKAAGKYRQEGKGYTVLDGDVIFFKFNVTASKKK
jgi:obg-like ATPase 1